MNQSQFTPQVTNMGSFKSVETKLFDHFVAAGYQESLARTIAHTFTNYVLGYITRAGAFRLLVESGANSDVAASLVESFDGALNGSVAGADGSNEPVEHRHAAE